jgi:hypothetical protein
MPPAFDRATPSRGFRRDVVRRTSTRLVDGWLWPALAYKVLLPSRGNPPFNVFQRAVLDMCRAGVRDVEEISRRFVAALRT